MLLCQWRAKGVALMQLSWITKASRALKSCSQGVSSHRRCSLSFFISLFCSFPTSVKLHRERIEHNEIENESNFHV